MWGYRDRLAKVRLGTKCGVIDRLGETVTPFEFEFLSHVSYHNSIEYMAAKRDGRYGVVDLAGNTLLDFTYDEQLYAYPRGLIEMCRPIDRYNSKNGVISLSGEVIVPCNYDCIHCGLDAIFINIGFKISDKNVRNGKWGWTDLHGNTIVEPRYRNQFHPYFLEGLAQVKWRGRFGYANQAGDIVIPFKYDWAGGFKDGVATVQLKGEKFHINKSGERV